MKVGDRIRFKDTNVTWTITRFLDGASDGIAAIRTDDGRESLFIHTFHDGPNTNVEVVS